jgi:hypothetical protein
MKGAVHLDAKMVPAHLRGGYRGKTMTAVVTETVTVPPGSGVWDEGSKETWRAVRIEDGATMPLSADVTAADGPGFQSKTVTLRPGFCVICHSITRGQDAGLTFYLNPLDAAPLLPATVTLTAAERIVLVASHLYKASYAGKTRFEMARDDNRAWITGHIAGERQITRAEWEAAKQGLIGRGLLNKVGAITTAGRNAIAEVV